MYIVVGLGNPSPRYEDTPHNVGFWAVDTLAQRPCWRAQKRALVCEEMWAGQKILFVKPQTFVNLSGQSVGALCRFYKVAAACVVVIHDDLDLPLGDVRLKRGGGSGGHNGLKSVIGHIGEDFWRIRIGIGRPQEDPACYVLTKMDRTRHEALKKAVESLAAGLPLLWQSNDPLSRFREATAAV